MLHSILIFTTDLQFKNYDFYESFCMFEQISRGFMDRLTGFPV